MEVKEIHYSELRSGGDYNNRRIGVSIEIDNDHLGNAFGHARKIVRSQHELAEREQREIDRARSRAATDTFFWLTKRRRRREALGLNHGMPF